MAEVTAQREADDTTPAAEQDASGGAKSSEPARGEPVASSTSDEPTSAGGGDDTRPKRGRPRKTAAKSGAIELVLTVTGSAEGTDWHADVAHGGKRVVTALAVPASAVAAAAKDLHPDIADAIETVLSAARERQRSRVEQLQAELQAAQRALADLED